MNSFLNSATPTEKRNYFAPILRAESNWIFSTALEFKKNAQMVLAPSTVAQFHDSSLPEHVLTATIHKSQIVSPWVAKIEQPGVLDDALDLLILHHVLDTQPNPDQWLGLAMRAVAPGGKLVLINSSKFGLWHLLGRASFGTGATRKFSPRVVNRDIALLERHHFYCESVLSFGAVFPWATQETQGKHSQLHKLRASHLLILVKRGGQVISIRNLIAKKNISSGLALNPSHRVWRSGEAA